MGKVFPAYLSTLPDPYKLALEFMGLEAAELGLDLEEAVLLRDGVLSTFTGLLLAPASLNPARK